MDWFLMHCEVIIDYLTAFKAKDALTDLKVMLIHCSVGLLRFVDWIRRFCNSACRDLEAWQVAAYTFFFICLFLWCESVFSDYEDPFVIRVKNFLFRSARRLPWVKRKISIQLNQTRQSVQMELQKNDPDMDFLRHLPDLGMSMEEIRSMASRYKGAGSFDFANGRVSGAVYNANDELAKLNAEMTEMFCWANPLHPDIFPGIRKMEAEIVRIVCNLFNGGQHACGTVTSGGTESIMLACLAYRNRAYAAGNHQPEMVIPFSAHSAFDKAGSVLRIRVRRVPLEPATCKVDVDKLKTMVNRQTCMIVVSAPNYPHGIIDPVEVVAAIGERRGIPVHVDCCLGGFLLPFMDRADYPLEEAFDFRVRGVTSISCDTHKYGFASKGTSVVMYRSRQYMRHQYFSQPNWPGGIYATATFAGSRSGALVAGCWATLLRLGSRGYIEATRSIIHTTRYIERKLRRIKGIYVFGHPRLSVVAFTSYVFNIYTFQSKMSELGWCLNLLQQPPAVHLCVTLNQTREGVAKAFVQDATDVAEELLKNPSSPSSGTAAFYGIAHSIPDRSLIEEIAYAYLDACYATDKKCEFEDLDD
uniref:sphinganine-1-phosphate aldolase n=1 Tax=Trichuris muris TaxID=70415 RepID=A0A5S6R5A8_TRIMR